MVGILDYGMGNLLSVLHAVETLGFDASLCRIPEEVASCERLILPGVGAFGDCMANLHQSGLWDALEDFAIQRARPVLGICLGMQAMAKVGNEGGVNKGLGWFDAEVVRLSPNESRLRVPQVGWNNVKFSGSHAVTAGLPQDPEFYFVHSYWMHCAHAGDVLGECEYGGSVTAAVARDNLVATQFHPEKSQEFGLKFLENFLSWKP